MAGGKARGTNRQQPAPKRRAQGTASASLRGAAVSKNEHNKAINALTQKLNAMAIRQAQAAVVQHANMDFRPSATAVKKQQRFQSNPGAFGTVAPRGHGYYDAFQHGTDNAVTASTVGAAVQVEAPHAITLGPILGKRLGSLDMNGNPDHIIPEDNGRLIVFNGSSCDDIIAKVYQKSTSLDGTQTLTPLAIAAPVLTSGLSTPSLQVRGSIRIANISSKLSRGGLVTVLNTGVAIGGLLNWTDYDRVANMVRGSRQKFQIDAAEMKGKNGEAFLQFNQYVADGIRASTFRTGLNFSAAINGVGVPHTVQDGLQLNGIQFVSPTDYVVGPSLTNVIILIEPFLVGNAGRWPIPSDNPALVEEGNTFALDFRIQRLQKHQPGTLLGTMMKTTKTGDAPSIDPQVGTKPSNHH